MEIRPTSRATSPQGFFGVFRDPATYSNLGYLLLGLPLCIFYFTFVVTGISLSIGLTPLFLLGIPLLLGVVYIMRQLMKFEASLAGKVLDDEPLLPEPLPLEGGLFRRVGKMLGDPYTYKSVVYLLLKLPIGIIGFTFASIAIAGVVGGIASPVVWVALNETINVDIYGGPDNYSLWELLGFEVESSEIAVLNIALGFVIGFVFLHISNWYAWLTARFALFMGEDM